MAGLVHFEYAPPRSWEQFEELCADLFEAMWSDPNLARHGRAGQVQDGVDIVAARGSISPVGLQCKKKSKWPEKKIQFSEIISEIEKAEKFTPPLKEFYILTTALSDAKLQEKIRKLNSLRKRKGGFLVHILFWGEIVRKVALYPMVASKHFSVGTSPNDFSPLLSTWYTSGGKLELAGDEWLMAVSELFEDYYDWPTGHVIIRQRETDELIKVINEMEGVGQDNIRMERLEHRKELRRMKEKERYLQEVIHNVCRNEKLNFYVFELNEDGIDASVILKNIIERSLSLTGISSGMNKIRVCPPTPERIEERGVSSRFYLSDLTVNMSEEEYKKILEAELDFPNKHYGNKMSNVVSELPCFIRRECVVPAIIIRLHRIIYEDKITLEELDAAGYLDIHSWKYER